MSIETPTSGVTIHIDPNTTYSKGALADAMNLSTKTIERLTKDRRKFPRPFKIGRTPYWLGKTILNWLEKRQSEELA